LNIFVAACINRLPKSIATKGHHENAPSAQASAVPKNTGTAAAVRLKGRESLNHSASTGLRDSVTPHPPKLDQISRHTRPSVPALPPQF
jgi:hypothetical protein